MKLLAQVQEQLNTKLQRFCYFGCLLLLIFFVFGCQTQPDRSNLNSAESQTKTEDVGRSNTQLTLNDATLEQSNQTGNLVWKVRAKKTTYTDDRKIGYLADITANLLQEDKIILKLKGAKGEIREQGNLILLEQDIVASDVRNEMVLQSNIAEWRPLENTLVIKDSLQANRPDTNLSAARAVYYTDTESLELAGKVVVNNVRPNLVLESDRFVWQIPQQKIVTNNPIKAVRYQGRAITERLLGNSAEIDLEQQTATFNNNVELTSLKPTLKVATVTAIWNYQQRTVDSNKPIRAVTKNLTVTGNRGTIDLERETVVLAGGVEGNTSQGAALYAQNALWGITQQEIVATGDIIYRETQPKVRLTGDKAVINLQTNRAVVTSNRPQTKPVISRIQQD